MPTSIVFNYKDGIYTIDSDGKDDATDKNILLWMVRVYSCLRIRRL